MTRTSIASPALFAVAVACALAACDRGTGSGADSARTTGSTVQATPAGATASTPMPVSPSGLTNSSTAATGNDLSNSTRASGTSNVYQPPSSDNPPPGGAAAGTAGAASSAASQSVSSQTRGTSLPPNDGTLPGGNEGNSGSRSGGGKM
jgi:hypothetical protein